MVPFLLSRTMKYARVSNCHSPNLYHSRSSEQTWQITELKCAGWGDLCRFTPTKQRQAARYRRRKGHQPNHSSRAGGTGSRTEAWARQKGGLRSNCPPYSCIEHTQRARRSIPEDMCVMSAQTTLRPGLRRHRTIKPLLVKFIHEQWKSVCRYWSQNGHPTDVPVTVNS